jgi:hypothetical protein
MDSRAPSNETQAVLSYFPGPWSFYSCSVSCRGGLELVFDLVWSIYPFQKLQADRLPLSGSDSELTDHWEEEMDQARLPQPKLDLRLNPEAKALESKLAGLAPSGVVPGGARADGKVLPFHAFQTGRFRQSAGALLLCVKR